MRIATWNVNSLKARLEKVEWWLGRAAPDVLLLQETKLADDTAPLLPFSMAGYELLHHGEGRWNGVAIVSRVGLADVVTNCGDGAVRPSLPAAAGPGDEEDFDPSREARMVSAICGGIRVVSIYAPNGRHVEVAADHERGAGLLGLVEPAAEPGEPGKLARVERRSDEAPVRGVDRDDTNPAADRADHPRLARRVEVLLVARACGGGEGRPDGPVPEVRDDVRQPHPAHARDAVPAPLAVLEQRVAGHREGEQRRGVVGELRLLEQQDVGRGALKPPLHLLQARLEGVDVPGRDPHGSARPAQYRRPRCRARSNVAVSATAMTAIVPAWTGSVTTRSTCSVMEPTMLRAMIGMPTARSSSAARLMSPPMIEPARTRHRARGRSATARTAPAMFASPTRAIVSTEMRSPRRLCRSASETAPSATWATCAPPPTTMIRLPKIRSMVRVARRSRTPGAPATAASSAASSTPSTSISVSTVGPLPVSSSRRTVLRVRSVARARARAARIAGSASGVSSWITRIATVGGAAARRALIGAGDGRGAARPWFSDPRGRGPGRRGLRARRARVGRWGRARRTTRPARSAPRASRPRRWW